MTGGNTIDRCPSLVPVVVIIPTIIEEIFKRDQGVLTERGLPIFCLRLEPRVPELDPLARANLDYLDALFFFLHPFTKAPHDHVLGPRLAGSGFLDDDLLDGTIIVVSPHHRPGAITTQPLKRVRINGQLSLAELFFIL